MNKDYTLDLIASLQQAKSKKQVNADIRRLEKAINMLSMTATLAKGNTQNEINNYMKELSGKLDILKLKGKLDDKNLKREIDKSLHHMTFKEIDALNIDGSKTKIKIRKVIADMKAYAEKTPLSVNVSLKKDKLSKDLTAFLSKNSRVGESSALLAESERIRELIDSVNDPGTLGNAADALGLFQSEVINMGYAGKSASRKIKDLLGHITKIGNFFGVASLAVNNFRKSLSTLRSNDTILTEISKNSQMTKRQLQELGEEAFQTASKYGQLSGNYLLGVQEMVRSGYGALSKELSELSLLAQSAGSMTADSANSYLLATDAAYKYGGSIEKLSAVLDGANYISNQNLASLTDIADATRIAASFAANAGIAIDELTAAEAAMIAATKRSGSEIGQAFRSIILNLQQVSGEFDDEIIDEEQLKRVEARCHSLGVELEYVKEGAVKLRKPMEVLKDLANVYESLPDNSAEKQGLLSDIGGKDHADALSGLLSQWDLYEKMLGEFSQGTGSALEEAEKTASSWEGRLNSLSNSFDSFVNTLTDKNAILGGISFFDRLIQGAQALTNSVGEIPVILTALNSVLAATNKDYGITQIWNKDKGKIDLQGNIFGIDITNIKNMKKHFAEAEEAINKWNVKLKTGKADINDFDKAIVKNNAQFKEYLSTCSKDAPASIDGYKSHLKAAGKAVDGFRLKTVLLNAAVSFGIGSAMQLVGTIGTAVVKEIDKHANASKHAAESAQALASEMNSSINSMSGNASTLSDLNKEYQILSKGVNQLGENIGLSTDDYTRYKQIIGQVSEIMPNLTMYFNAQGEKIAFAKGKLSELNNEYEDYIKKQANDYITNGDSEGHKIQDILDDYNSNEALSDFEKSWNDFKIRSGFGSIKDFTTKEITAELESLKNLKSIDEIRDVLNHTKFIYASSGQVNHNTALRYFILEQLDLVSKSREQVDSMTEADYNAIMQSITSYIQTYEAKIASDMNQVRTALLQETFSKDKYWEIENEDVRNDITTFLSSISSDTWDALNIKTDNDLSVFVNKIIESMDENKDGFADAWNGLFDVELKDLPVNEYVQQVDGFLKTICNVLDLDEVSGVPMLRVSLGLDDDYEYLPRKFQNAVSALIKDPKTLGSDEYLELIDIINKLTYAEAELCLEAITGAESVTDAITKVKSALAPETMGYSSFEDAWSASFTSENESVKKLGETLLDLAAKGRLTIEAFNEADSTNYFKNLNISAEEAVSKINKLADESQQLSSMSGNISKISEALGAKRDDGFVSADTLSGFDAEIRGLESWDHFQEVLGNVNSSYNDCREAANALASEWADNSDFLAQLTEQNKEYYATQLKAMGVENYQEIIEHTENLNIAKEALKLASFDLAAATAQEVKALISEGTYSTLAKEQIWNLILAKQTAEVTNLNTANDCQRLQDLAKNAGVTGKSIELLTELMSIYNNLEHGVYGTNKDVLDEVKARAEAIKQNIMNLLEDNASKNVELKPNLKLSSSAKSAAKAAGKETGKSYLDGVKEELSKMGSIISYVGKILGNKITSYSEQKDAAVKALEAEKNAAKEVLEAQKDAAEAALKAQKDAVAAEKDSVQAQIDAKQEEIDKINEAAKARKNELDLQKAQYDLARMQNQRTSLIYSEDKGMHYVTDTKGIRDAKENVADVKESIRVSGIEKEIGVLEKKLDAINQQAEALDQQAEASDNYYDTLMEASDSYYDRLIKDTESYWAGLISGFEKYQTRWEELADMEENAKMNAALKEFSITSDEILNLSEEKFESFKQRYLAILASADRSEPETAAYRERQPQKMMNDKSNAGTDDAIIVTKDGQILYPLQPGDAMYDMVQKWNAYFSRVEDKLAPASMYEQNRQFHDAIRQISNVSNIVQNQNNQPVINGGLNVTCPGITSQEVARQVGVELNNMFRGLHLEAYQRSMTR